MKKWTVLIFAGLIFSEKCQAQSTQVGIDRTTGISRIQVQGQASKDYNLFGSSDLSTSTWDFLATLSLTNTSQNWFDSDSSSKSKRFYRALKLASPADTYGDDFRLIDHQGVSRSLYWYENATNGPTPTKAIVLIFTGNGCSSVQQMVPAIKTLRDQYTPQGVVFWMIDSNSGDNRSNIVVEANNLGIDLPILHDRAQIVARAYQAAATPEAICLDRVDWRIFYRGTIDDRLGSTTNSYTQYYLKNALTDFLAGRTVSPRASHTNGCAITLNALATPSYSTDVAPILLNKCVRCHSPGNFAPFALTSYSTAASHAADMRVEVLAGRMPPWHADPYYQSFTNDFSLTPDEAAKLVKWIDDGWPRGGGPDPLTNAPPATDYPFDWPLSLGTPSNTITLPTQSIGAVGTNNYRYYNYTYTGATTWLKAAIILPGTVPVVHHILAYNAAGDDGVHSSFITGYAPGSYLGAFPTNTGKLLTNNTVIRFELHYVAIGQATTDVSRLGLYTMPLAPTYPLVETAVAGDLHVPANSTSYQTNITWPAPINSSKAVYLYEFSPHLHTRGSWFKYEAVYPDNSTEVLISVPHYVFHWQNTYRLTTPKYLPAGTRIRCTAGWDNSYQNGELMELYTNMDDPNHANYSPQLAVDWGQQTWNEMFIGYFNYTVIP